MRHTSEQAYQAHIHATIQANTQWLIRFDKAFATLTSLILFGALVAFLHTF